MATNGDVRNHDHDIWVVASENGALADLGSSCDHGPGPGPDLLGGVSGCDYDFQTDCELVLFPEWGAYSFEHGHGHGPDAVESPWALYAAGGLLFLEEVKNFLSLCKAVCPFLVRVMETCWPSVSCGEVGEGGSVSWNDCVNATTEPVCRSGVGVGGGCGSKGVIAHGDEAGYGIDEVGAGTYESVGDGEINLKSDLLLLFHPNHYLFLFYFHPNHPVHVHVLSRVLRNLHPGHVVLVLSL